MVRNNMRYFALCWPVIVLALSDIISKFWLLLGYDLGAKGRVTILPFMDFILVWNKGVSYSLFTSDSQLARWALVALMLGLCVFLSRWLLSTQNSIEKWGLTLILGGALGNSFDRIYHGAVVDFVALHYNTFHWYIFNLADVYIVMGACILAYFMFFLQKRQ